MRPAIGFSLRTGLSAGLAAALTLLSATTAQAQHAANIQGTVMTAESHAPISGARVSIPNPQRVAIADDHGAYVLRDIPPGRYVVTFTAIGRKPDSTTVRVLGASSVVVDHSLVEGSLLLSSVISSATRTPIQASQATATVNVLTPEQVRQSPARESQDLLREVPAVELPRTSSLVGGTAQIVSIRGVDEGRTAVLADGIPINDAWGEWIDWGRVPKSMLDHVEVVEGGQSSLYGNGALGGVISFFTRPLAPGAVDMQVDGGSRDERHGYVAAGVPLAGALSANVSGDYQAGGGYNLTEHPLPGALDDQSNIIQRNGFLRLNYAPASNWSAFLGGHLFGDSRNTGTPLSFASRDQRDVSFGLDYGTMATGQLGVRAWDGRETEYDRSTAFESAATRTAEDSSIAATIPSHDWGASAIWSHGGTGAFKSFSVGGDFRHVQGNYDELDYNTAGCAADPTGSNCHTLARTVTSGGSQDLSGVFAQAIVAPITPLRIELSARGDRWDNDNGHSFDITPGSATNDYTTYGDSAKTAFSPRAGVRYQLTSSFALRGAYYRAFRAPNLAELYRKQVSSSSITLPNPYLSSENAEGREAGFDWQPREWLQLKGTYYVADYNNFNVPTNLTATTTPARPAACGNVATCRIRLNVTKVRSQGGEAYLAFRPVQALFLSAGVNYDDDRQQSGLPAGTTNDEKPHVNRVPSPKQTIRATYSSPKLGDWTAMWRHEGPTTTLQGVWMDPFSVLDVNVQRDLTRDLRGFVSVENLTNTVYEVNVAGSGTTANPLIISRGLPRTVRVGVEAYRF